MTSEILSNSFKLKSEEIMFRQEKKILVINSQSVYKNNATGITLRSILSTFEPEQILELFRFESDNCVKERMSFTSLQIPPASMPINYWLRRIMGNDNYRDHDSAEGSPYGADIKYSWKQVAKITAKTVAENSWIIPNKSFVKKVDEFAPDYIYTLSASFYINKWVRYFADRYRIPVVIHYMDNWRETAYTQDERTRWINKIFERQVESLEDRMKCGLTISESMRIAYTNKYHRKYMAAMNTVKVLPCIHRNSNKIVIVYAGGLHLKRNETLKKVSDFIRNKAQYELHIYTNELDICEFSNDFIGENTFFHTAVPHEEIYDIYAQSDILLHIESFDAKVIEYTKYSMSTKIPEYMMSGRPIVCYAPHNIAAYQYVEQSNAGIGVENTAELENALTLLANPEKRKYYGVNGHLVAVRNHSVDSLRRLVKEVFGDD